MHHNVMKAENTFTEIDRFNHTAAYYFGGVVMFNVEDWILWLTDEDKRL